VWSLATQLSIIGHQSVWPPIYLLDFSLTLCQSLPFVGQQAGLGVECQILLTRQLLTIKGSNMPKNVACCLCILRSSFCSWPKFVLTHCTNTFQGLLTPSQDIKEMPTVSSLGFFTKVGPFANLDGFNFHQFVEPEKLLA